MDFCIVSAGMGKRFEPFAGFANKALAPFPYESTISLIIDKIPADSRIFIVVGYKSKDLSEIIKLFHPDRDIEFIHNDNYMNEGMGDSLLPVLDIAKSPLIVMPNDGIYSDLSIIKEKDTSDALLTLGCTDNDELLGENYLFLNKEADNVLSYARGGQIIYNKSQEHKTIFTGLMVIHDIDHYKEMLASCKKPRLNHWFSDEDVQSVKTMGV